MLPVRGTLEKVSRHPMTLWLGISALGPLVPAVPRKQHSEGVARLLPEPYLVAIFNLYAEKSP